MDKQDATAIAVRGGLEAMRTMALIRLVMETPDRLRIICTKCWLPHPIDDIILKKVPAKMEVYYSGICKDCEGGDIIKAVG